jgi:branched-chain amino acid transport system ATP-binding protein
MADAMNDYILEASSLTKRFGGFLAVNGASLKVRKNSIHALIGPNGAGKTTTFNLLTKFLTPTSGKITFEGEDITALGADEIARKGLVRSFQISAIFPELTVLQNVRVALQRKRSHNFDLWHSVRRLDQLDDQARSFLASVGLGDVADKPAAELSYGRKRALEIATTLALDPKMLLLDEPTAGMTHEDVGAVVELIRAVRPGRTILMVEHNLSVVENLCDCVTVMARGQVLVEGDYATVAADPQVITAYLGASDAED